MTNREKLQYTLSFFADVISLVCSALMAWLVFDYTLALVPDYIYPDRIHFYGLLFFAFFTAFLCFDQTGDIAKREWRDELRMAVLFNMILLVLFTALLVISKAKMVECRYLLFGSSCFNIFYMLLFHQLLRAYLNRPDTVRSLGILTGVISTTDRAGSLLRALNGDWTKQVHGIALLDADRNQIGTRIEGASVRTVGMNFLEWVRRDALDEVYVNIPYESTILMLPYLAELESMGVNIHLNVPLIEMLGADGNAEKAARHPQLAKSVEEPGGIFMVTLRATGRSFSDTVMKRCIDIVGSIVGLAISAPIIAVMAIPLKLESKGPLFFKQKRVGRNGRVFEMYKLRSMYIDAEEQKLKLSEQNEMNGLMFKITDDPRVTRIGRFIRRTSIDELPQFWNVLKGNMSLVGTRPPTIDEYSRYKSYHKRRLSMTPGITGMWQVSGRSDINEFEEVVRLDVEYIDNWSLLLDIKIILKTIKIVFSNKGAR